MTREIVDLPNLKMVDFPVRYVKVPEALFDFDVLENRFHHLMIIPIGNSVHRGATPQEIYYSIYII